ncbi:MAG: phage tail fiber protein [Thiobacillus sp.]
MAGTSNYLQNKLVDWELRGQAFTPPATLYVALLIASNGPIARSTVYAVGNTASFVAADGKNHLYKCTAQTAATAATAPAFPGVSNEAITDGGVTWTEQTSALEAGTAQVEPAVGGYARASIACSLANFAGTQGAGTTVASTGTDATSSNNITISYPSPSATWDAAPAEIWGFCTYDAATAGNPLRYGGLTADQIVNTGNAVSFAAGQLTIVFDK